jgi:hypothetical protein
VVETAPSQPASPFPTPYGPRLSEPPSSPHAWKRFWESGWAEWLRGEEAQAFNSTDAAALISEHAGVTVTPKGVNSQRDRMQVRGELPATPTTPSRRGGKKGPQAGSPWANPDLVEWFRENYAAMPTHVLVAELKERFGAVLSLPAGRSPRVLDAEFSNEEKP